MTTITEKDLEFTFDKKCRVIKYDDSKFYTDCFRKVQNVRAVDAVCVNGGLSWLIEITDYSKDHGLLQFQSNRLVNEVVKKMLGTLVGLATAVVAGDNDVYRVAAEALRANRWGIVLHIEGLRENKGLNKFSKDLLSGLLIKLLNMLKPITKRVIVTDMDSLPKDIPWTVKQILPSH